MAKRLGGLQEVLKDFDEEPVPKFDRKGGLIPGSSTTATQLFALALGRGRAKDPIRAIDVALRLYRHTGTSIELDDEDVGLLETTIRSDEVFSDLARAFLLRILSSAVDTAIDLGDDKEAPVVSAEDG